MYKKLLDLASYRSYWRGYTYAKEHFVKSTKQINKNQYEGIVQGSEDYHVFIDLEHPKKSTCDCPHAKDRQIICKHKVALAMTIFPEALKEADKVQEEIENERKAYEQRQEERYEAIKKEVSSWSIEQLRNYVINTKFEEQNCDEYDPYEEYEDEYFYY